jgi:hypothetical protein
MRVLYIEGVAIHGGPESCAGVCEGVGEALIGVVQAGLLSREITGSGVPTSSHQAEGHILVSAIASWLGTPRGQRPRACTEFFMRENREIRSLPVSGASVGLRRAVGATLWR